MLDDDAVTMEAAEAQLIMRRSAATKKVIAEGEWLMVVVAFFLMDS